MITKSLSEVWKRSMMSQIPKVTVDEVVEAKNSNNTGTVIILHGAGGTGGSMKEWIELLKKDIAFPHLKIIFPTAPVRPYTAHEGMLENVWFDRKRTSIDDSEHVETLNQAAEGLKEIIQKEIDSGIPAERIVIGGFSMGGAMSLHMGYRIIPNIGGVFALSSFLNSDSLLYEELARNKPDKLATLFYTHGDKDDLVPLKWGKLTFEKLRKLGIEGTFNIKQNAFHELKKKELNSLWEWIAKIVPYQ